MRHLVPDEASVKASADALDFSLRSSFPQMEGAWLGEPWHWNGTTLVAEMCSIFFLLCHKWVLNKTWLQNYPKQLNLIQLHMRTCLFEFGVRGKLCPFQFSTRPGHRRLVWRSSGLRGWGFHVSSRHEVKSLGTTSHNWSSGNDDVCDQNPTVFGPLVVKAMEPRQAGPDLTFRVVIRQRCWTPTQRQHGATTPYHVVLQHDLWPRQRSTPRSKSLKEPTQGPKGWKLWSIIMTKPADTSKR